MGRPEAAEDDARGHDAQPGSEEHDGGPVLGPPDAAGCWRYTTSRVGLVGNVPKYHEMPMDPAATLAPIPCGDAAHGLLRVCQSRLEEPVGYDCGSGARWHAARVALKGIVRSSGVTAAQISSA